MREKDFKAMLKTEYRPPIRLANSPEEIPTVLVKLAKFISEQEEDIELGPVHHDVVRGSRTSSHSR